MSHNLDPARRLAGTRRAWLGLLILAWGGQAIVTQSLLLREAMVLMLGTEFAWGIVLSAWLLGVAAGAALGGWLADRTRRPDLALSMALMGLAGAACVDLWVFRGARTWLGVQPGELVPLPGAAVLAAFFVTPAGLLVGLAFPLACCVGPPQLLGASARENRATPNPGRSLLQFGQVYALESAGSLIAGALFSFWAVDHLAPIETALYAGAATALASSGLLAANRQHPRAAVLTGAAGLAAVALAGLAGGAINQRLVQRRWQALAPGYALVAAAESRYQNLAVGRLADQFTLYCDGRVASDFPDPYTFAPLAHLYLCQHPSPVRVLVIGGGAEGLLAEILRHPVVRLDYVEADPLQIPLLSPFLDDEDAAALADPRVTLHHVDARHYIKKQQGRFDLVVARLPEPISAQRARLYTDEFFSELRRAMTRQAVLCMAVAAAPGELPPATREYVATIKATLARHFGQVIVGWGDPAQVLAATASGLLTTDADELTRRYAQRDIRSPRFDVAWFDGATDWFAPEKVARRADELAAAVVTSVPSDLRPSIYLSRLVLWDQATGGRAASAVQRLRTARVWHVIVGLGLICGLALLHDRWRGGPRKGWAHGIVSVSLGTTGFATMSLTIIWLFAFQNLYGYVYQRIGWLIAVFMGGLVIGCLVIAPTKTRPTTDASARRWWRWLLCVDGLQGLLALVVPWTLPALAAMQTGPTRLKLVESCVLAMLAVTGALCGAAFAVAGPLRLSWTGRTGSAAGSVVGADHAGACLGALLCATLLVPVFGTLPTAMLLAGVKFASCALVAAGPRLARAAQTPGPPPGSTPPG